MLGHVSHWAKYLFFWQYFFCNNEQLQGKKKTTLNCNSFPHITLTTHIGVFSIIFVTYLFMCATEGQAFDDLFVIIFISSQEKF